MGEIYRNKHFEWEKRRYSLKNLNYYLGQTKAWKEKAESVWSTEELDTCRMIR